MINMRFRIQVDLGPQTRIAIFQPDESHLPDEQKTYFTEMKMGVLADQPDSAILVASDLIVDGSSVGVDLTRFRERTGRTDTPNFVMPADAFRKFIEDYKEKEE
jgi:hypothetical protein